MTTERQRLIIKAVRSFIPQVPLYDAEKIRTQAQQKHLRRLNPEVAAWLSVVAYIRHVYTSYDELREEGYERDAAYFFVYEDINDKLLEWRATRLLDINEQETENWQDDVTYATNKDAEEEE